MSGTIGLESSARDPSVVMLMPDCDTASSLQELPRVGSCVRQHTTGVWIMAEGGTRRVILADIYSTTFYLSRIDGSGQTAVEYVYDIAIQRGYGISEDCMIVETVMDRHMVDESWRSDQTGRRLPRKGMADCVEGWVVHITQRC